MWVNGYISQHLSETLFFGDIFKEYKDSDIKMQVKRPNEFKSVLEKFGCAQVHPRTAKGFKYVFPTTISVLEGAEVYFDDFEYPSTGEIELLVGEEAF